MDKQENKKNDNNRANQMNPNHEKSGKGNEADYKGTGDKADLDNHANHLNPNHPEFKGHVE